MSYVTILLVPMEKMVCHSKKYYFGIDEMKLSHGYSTLLVTPTLNFLYVFQIQGLFPLSCALSPVWLSKKPEHKIRGIIAHGGSDRLILHTQQP
jgi:hypothetical protein